MSHKTKNGDNCIYRDGHEGECFPEKRFNKIWFWTMVVMLFLAVVVSLLSNLK